ncbi:glycosyltransferase family 4 protein [Blastopirellula retiformator]|uniref:Glycogen synthase n=1 Tax=Blastopirellula retiformator TaxID=2527970 RepID=A0A5C5VA99_9BACT|nr:glycosyltransferase family 1 protein [Blastopirellula retiformator]TWT34632.1 Glycogen synthase [Blastopirellula retiformator]
MVPTTQSAAEVIRVGFNANLLVHPSMRGWNRYAVNLLENLPGAGVELVLYSMEPIAGAFRSRLESDAIAFSVSGKMSYFGWEQRWLPRQLRRDGIDAFHSPFHFGVPLLSPCPCVVTLHDAIGQRRWPAIGGWRGLANVRQWLNFGSHEIARRKSTKVITVSRFSQQELVRRLGIDAAKIIVIPEAADPTFAAIPSEELVKSTLQKFELPKPYFFYIGGFDARKNLPFLIRAFAAAEMSGVDLVLAGGDTTRQEELRDLSDQLDVSHQVRFIGRVDDTDLPALYRDALAFVYPSREEGFGLQLCEAMAMESPILASNATSLPEVLGDGGALFDPTQLDQLRDWLRRTATDPVLRKELAAKSRSRGADFSWRQTARETASVYRSIVASAGGAR